MILRAGTRLGTYEILAPLCAGVMGEVFRARDSGSDEAADRAQTEGRALNMDAALADAAAWVRELEAGEAT